ncbi:MocR-like pyridoxine biosynthesis transcription factor PdxR [Enterovibrio calviensis]|uniref:MocR-like pyridoxine biosynthesis transcription factor PdxR n=1 Tax=Enterovibrio calviensis TaxID=91359 RepID=UPI000481DE05|nr:PLP-dependent aminotransferase family protein [Enterovibrio calviensis]
MQLIDVGDLSLNPTMPSKQSALYSAIQEKILSGQWPTKAKLPSSRLLAQELMVSRNTVTAVYEQLKAEGYIESRRGAGFFIQLVNPESYLLTQPLDAANTAAQASQTKQTVHAKLTKTTHTLNVREKNRPFATGVPDLVAFPYRKWTRALQSHADRLAIAGQNDIQGSHNLRAALSEYLSISRSVDAPSHRIITTLGAQQALYIAMSAVLERGDEVMMENPGYVQMRKVLNRCDATLSYLPFSIENGVDISPLETFEGKAIYLTPSNQYPMGTSIDTNRRKQCIDWAVRKQRWVIEDDYDSEFQFANRPYPSLQGLAAKFYGAEANVIYIGTFSKTLLPAIRVGYMVVPESLVEKCLNIKDAIGGDTPIHVEEALAEFIRSGDYLRHIRRMRNLYQGKQQFFVEQLREKFGDHVEVLSQDAGLHVTFRWKSGPDAITVKHALAEQGITIRTLDYYCDPKAMNTMEEWIHRALVAGFGNSSREDIVTGINALAECMKA